MGVLVMIINIALSQDQGRFKQFTTGYSNAPQNGKSAERQTEPRTNNFVRLDRLDSGEPRPFSVSVCIAENTLTGPTVSNASAEGQALYRHTDPSACLEIRTHGHKNEA